MFVKRTLDCTRCECDMVCRRPTRRDWGRTPLPFFENRKKHPEFEKKGPEFVHLLVKFSIQNVVLRVSKNFSLRGFFYCLFSEMFIKMP